MSREVSNPNLQVIESLDDLLWIFKKGARDPFHFQIGMEFERFLVDQHTLRALPYEGKHGIEEFLETVAKSNSAWEKIHDQGKLISLRRGDTAITLEPGGQIEISSRAYRSQQCLYQDLKSLDCEMKEIAASMGAKYFETGIHPTETVETSPWMPKSRYKWMKQYYTQRNSRAGLEMMALTSSIQVNYDYKDETDAKKKILMSSFMSPVLAAVFANAAIEQGKPNGYMTRRIQIWGTMDPDRTGTPEFFVDDTFTFEKYRDYALDVPMYFALRDGNYVDAHNQTFRQFLNNKGGEIGPVTMGDWDFHLTTLFPEVRLKNHLEFRIIDSNSADVVVAIAAFWKGLFHDDASVDRWYEFFKQFTKQDLDASLLDVSKHALKAKLGSHSVLDIAKKLFNEARINLEKDIESRSEVQYLLPMKQILDSGISPAESDLKKLRAVRS
ncbi:MAG: glutamate-cysteine ligase family protein [Bdellovibrionota bacterium]